MTRSERRGLRLLSGFAGLLALVFCAWLAQQLIIEELRRRQATGKPMVGEPELATMEKPELAPLEEGWGRVVVGAPSGAAPRLRPDAPLDPEPVAPAGEGPDVGNPGSSAEPLAPEVPASPPPRWPADLELVVRSGQSLSKIVAAEYGRSTPELVDLLARYNGMDDPDKLRLGQSLRIPVRGKLLETAD